MAANQCPEHAHLQAEVMGILEEIKAITAEQLRAFQENDRARFSRLDKELEHALGEKEPSIGDAPACSGTRLPEPLAQRNGTASV